MRRRSVLAGAIAAPIVLGLGIDLPDAGYPLPGLTLYDARLPRAERAAWQMHLRGGDTRKTGGEIAALLLRERLFARIGPVLGITGHAEFLLARDIGRMAGKRVSPLMQAGLCQSWLGGTAEEAWRPLLAGLLDNGAQQRSTGTAYAWIAA